MKIFFFCLTGSRKPWILYPFLTNFKCTKLPLSFTPLSLTYAVDNAIIVLRTAISDLDILQRN